MSTQDTQERVDKLFERFSAHTPGCAAGAVQHGKILFAKGYGLADLEHGVPLSADSRFFIASVSKQFTAMSVLLLAEDGLLNVNDLLRKTIPEMPDCANRVTLYHLLTHTSGIRDYLTLDQLAGHPRDFVITDRSALLTFTRQRALNFEPGSEFLYSNSGYVLLSLVVKRLTMKNLDDVAQERIFRPLEMQSTRFQHDHTALVPDKAAGYEWRESGWRVSNCMLDVVGDGGLYSSVQDMLRWAANFDDPSVGALALPIMQTPVTLRDGTKIKYGMGLVPDEYRGLRIVEHSGSLAGYVTEFLRFPAQKLSVVCLCNNATASPAQLARQVAEIYLSSEMTPVQPDRPQAVAGITLTARELREKAGLYRNERGLYLEILEKDGTLYSPEEDAALVALDKHAFAIVRDKSGLTGSAGGLEIRFDTRTPPEHVHVTPKGEPPLQFQRVERIKFSARRIQVYRGEFASPELNAIYRIVPDKSGLALEIGDRPPVLLTGVGGERMRVGDTSDTEIVFTRNAGGRATGFQLNAGPVRGVRFQRLR